jgi:hypothetical protein
VISVTGRNYFCPSGKSVESVNGIRFVPLFPRRENCAQKREFREPLQMAGFVESESREI